MITIQMPELVEILAKLTNMETQMLTGLQAQELFTSLALIFGIIAGLLLAQLVVKGWQG